MFLLPLTLLLCSSLSWAIHESDVGVIDWHKRLVGVPHAARIIHPENSSLVIVPTASNVLAALNLADGSVAWRYAFDSTDGIASFHVDGDSVVTLSGRGATNLRSFEATTGLITLDKRLEWPLSTGPTAVDVVFASDATFVLNTHSIARLGSGEVEWTWEAEDKSMPYTRLVQTPTGIYAVGLSSTSSSLYLAAVDPVTGGKIQIGWKHLPESVSSFVVAGECAAWVDPASQSLGFMRLTPTLKASIVAEKTMKWQEVVDVHLPDLLVGVLTSGDAKVLHAKEGGALEAIHTFPVNDGAHTLFSGGLDNTGEPYVVRLWTTADNTTAAEIFSATHGVAKVAFSLGHGTVTHLAVDGTRLVLTTSTGAVQLWDQNQLIWAREESLASIDVAAFVELPVPERVARVDESETFFARLTRQIGDARYFPEFVVGFAQRFAGAPPREDVIVSANNHSAALARDAYGFRQVLVVGTAHGTVYGLDSSSGEILWARVFGLGWASAVGGTVRPVKIFLVNSEDGADGEKDVVIIAQRKASNTLVDTVIFRINPVTGASVSPAEEDSGALLEGKDVISGPLTEAFLLPDSDIIILLDEFFQVLPYPDTDANTAVVTRRAPSIFMPFLESFEEGPRVLGHSLKLDPELSDRHVAFRTWGLTLPPGESVKKIVKPTPRPPAPIASLGKVLGNRTTLYKYLNPRMFVVLSEGSGEASIGCGVYVVDGAKGSILYSALVPAAGLGSACDVQATLTENWLVYHYYDGEGVGPGETKGWRVVTVELYEGELDEKTRSSELSAFSLESMQVEPLEQSYVFAHGITAITTTSTKYGISSKDIIVATQSNKINSIPRRLLNPRRPKNWKPTTEEMQEEQLIPYDPVMPDDPRRTISHNYDVVGTRQILTTPALLESTSLVFGYGLDMFLTRVAPSGTFDVLSESFNKAQLVLTVFGLGMGIGITRPMVRRKRLRERWYQ
ncbi:DUF1620-domain-containing protein [Roridomyces roridus]|uniref:ER membrane protein complex subunit 1 n=1 Tax=Roridomyces roridus TaxID=1738132 RepID=A0AAD7FAY3_9AGAR|nr:DUF1620-domain-containing protein [Roridomyces roridus]